MKKRRLFLVIGGFYADFGTAVAQKAAVTVRISCRADVSAEQNKPVAEICLQFFRNELIKLPFDDHLIGAVGQSQTTGNADAVRIRHNAALSVHISQNEIGNLAADAR